MLRIAIVGAGPAGTSAGCHLARRGSEVVLFDKALFPRDKPCGDWLTPLALGEIARVGLTPELLRERAGASAVITATVLRAPGGRHSRFGIGDRSHPAGCCVPRQRLDALLLAQALEAGCSFRQQALANVDAAQPTLAGFDVIVDARGSAAGNANAAGLRGYWQVTRTPGIDGLAREVSIRADPRCKRGYGWVFPVDVQPDVVTFNIGVGLWKADIRPGQGPREQLARFLAQDPVARHLDQHANRRSKPQGFPLAMGGWSGTQVGQGKVLRIGDAAQLADPLTGDGIGNALLSGRLLAEVVNEGERRKASGRPSTSWAQAWQTCFEQTLQPELRRAWCLRRLLEPTLIKNVAALALAHGPARLRESLHTALFGVRTYHDALF